MSTKPRAPIQPDVVYWLTGGKVLHRNPDCPPFRKVRLAILAKMEAGQFDHIDRVRSYDFNESDVVDNYPPENLMLCDRRECRRAVD